VTTFVLDASALIELAIGAHPDAALLRRARTGSGVSPELVDIEALHALRRAERTVEERILRRAVAFVAEAPITRVSHRPLLGRVWELRAAITAYDATYIALAEQLGVPLLTCDARLGRAHGHDAEVIVYPTS
jgi:predicted nucleic acid-binding protein